MRSCVELWPYTQAFEEYAKANPLPCGSLKCGRAIIVTQGTTFHIPDALAEPEYPAAGNEWSGAYRSNLGVPLLREGETMYAFILTRQTVEPFRKKQIDLVT